MIGAWKVAVHDNTRVYQPWEKPYFVLSRGRRLQHEDAGDREVWHRGVGAGFPCSGEDRLLEQVKTPK